MIRRLIEAAQSSLKDAKLKSLSNEGRFDLAYKAIMQSAKAALQAKGYRALTSKPGHHQIMLQALPLTIGLDKASLILLDYLRKQRNAIDYSGDLVSDALTTEAITQAETLLNLVQTLLIPVINLEDTNSEWIDPDDATEITKEDLKRGIWKINGRIVSEAEGRAAFAERLRNISKNKAGKT
jgi:HEPN domain-containing protein